MTATEELRAGLDELGVEYFAHENGEQLREPSETGVYPATSWQIGDANVLAVPDGQGTFDLWIDHCTPEQAIAATVGKGIEHYDGSGRRGTVAILQGCRKPEEVMFVQDNGGVTHYLPEGAGTCKNTQDDFDFMCSECGKCVNNGRVLGFKFCPNCGKRIKEEAK